MPEDDRAPDHPSLELPSFSFGRRRRRRGEGGEGGEPPVLQPPAQEQAVEEPAVEEPAVEDSLVPQPQVPEPAVQEPAVERPAPARSVLEDVPAPPAPATPPRSGEGALRRTVARTRRRGGAPGGPLAAVLTGLVAGLGLVGLTWASLRSCEAVQGTSSCGGAGYPLVAAIFVLMVVVAALLLRLARVPEPTSTSFLGLGLTGVVALLFLVDVLLDGSMVVVVPVLTAATFALSHRVTSSVTGPPAD